MGRVNRKKAAASSLTEPDFPPCTSVSDKMVEIDVIGVINDDTPDLYQIKRNVDGTLGI